MKPSDIVIDAEFQKLIRPLSGEERKELKDSLSRCGLLSPLVIWRHEDKNILVDGHNRISLWKEFDGFDGDFEFKTQELRFGNRDKVKEWIIKNQLGRRNLSPDDFKLLVGQLYNQRKKAAHGRSDRNFGSAKVAPPNTAEQVAEETGVSPRTVKSAGKLATAVEAIQAAEPELPREEVIAKAKGESKTAVAQLENTPEEEDEEYEKFLDSPFGKAAQAISKITESVPMPTPETFGDAGRLVDYLHFQLAFASGWWDELNRLEKEWKRQERAERKASKRRCA